MKKKQLKFGRFSILRLEPFGVSVLEVAGVNNHRSLFYFCWDAINGFDFSMLWLKSHGLPLAQGLRLVDVYYEPIEKKLSKKLHFSIFL